MNALILSGGAARGAYEAGVASALCERERFDIVCGTSIGAINGMLVAQGAAGELAPTWASMAGRGITTLRPELAVASAFAREVRGLRKGPLGARLRHLGGAVRALPGLRRLAALAHVDALFEDGNIRAAIAKGADFSGLRATFIAGVTNLSAGAADAFAYFPPGAEARRATFFASEPDAHALTAANYVQAVQASTALPPAFAPVDIACADGVTRTFCDGALTNNTPIRQAIDAGATGVTVIVLTHAGLRGAQRTVHSLPLAMAVMMDAAAERVLELDLKLVRRINEDVHRGHDDERRFINLRVIAPSVPLHLSGFSFGDQPAIDRVFAQGRADGRAAAELAPV